MTLTAVTVLVRGRPVVVSPEELRAELDASGPLRSQLHLEALLHAAEHGAPAREVAARLAREVAARLARALDGAGPGALTLQAVLGLVRLEARAAAPALRALSRRLPGSASAIAEAAAFLVEGDARGLARAAQASEPLAHFSPQPFLRLTRVPDGADALFAVWLGALKRAATHAGSTAYRALLGDVSEASFRALKLGAPIGALLSDDDRAWLLDAAAAELPGTTDFLAGRGMAWLLGALARDDDTARAAIERARERFRDPAFQADCAAILGGEPWPPRA